jgi:hypothetical protein
VSRAHAVAAHPFEKRTCGAGVTGAHERQQVVRIGEGQSVIAGVGARELGQLLPAAADLNTLLFESEQQAGGVGEIAVVATQVHGDAGVVERERFVEAGELEQK